MTPLVSGCASGGKARTASAVETTQPPIVTVASVPAEWFTSQVCNGSAPLTEPALLVADLDGDGLDDAVVSAVCSEGQPVRHVVFSEGFGALVPRASFLGNDLQVLSGSTATLAVVVPVTDADGAETDLVERLVHELTEEGIGVVERRQMTRAEYLAAYAPADQRIDRADLVAQWETGTAMMEPITCDGSGLLGSGFLVAPDLVMTNAHVATDAVVIRVEVAGSVVPGYVVGLDPVRDIALVRLTDDVAGHVFSLSPTGPEVGVPVSALGFPLIRQFSASSGEVSGINRRVEIGNAFLTDAIQTSAPINPGNSGGPLIDGTGTVVGMVTAGSDWADGIALAVPASHLEDALAEFGETDPAGPDLDSYCYTGNEYIDAWFVDVDLPPVLDSLTTYYSGVNSANYRQAWDINANSVGADEDAFQRFRSGVLTSFVLDPEIVDITRVGERAVDVDVAFRSEQEAELGHDGQTCSDWLQRYRMAQHPDGVWRIESSTSLVEPVSCSDE